MFSLSVVCWVIDLFFAHNFVLKLLKTIVTGYKCLVRVSESLYYIYIYNYVYI